MSKFANHTTGHAAYQLKRGTGLVLVAPQGGGKSRLARQIAMRHGQFQQIETGPNWDFELRDALNGQVQVLIIDGTPNSTELAQIKELLTSRYVAVRQPYSAHAVRRSCPHIILCTMDADWIPGGARRLDVIDLSKAVAHV